MILSDEFGQPVSRFLHPSVLRFVFVVFVAASSGTFAASWYAAPDRNNYDSGFFNLLSQSFLTLLASWCTVHPVLHDHFSKRRSRVELPAPTLVFILCFVATVCAAVAAPIFYAQLADRKSAENVGNTMNFVSAFFAVVTANQLARGVMCITD